jgi:VWFA-related protein
LLLVPGVTGFDGIDFRESSQVTVFAGETGGQEDLGEDAGQGRPDDPRTQAEDVQVVMLDGLPGGVGIVAHGRAHARELARGDGCAGTAAAHQHAAIGLPVANGLGDSVGNVGVIHGRGGVGAQVSDVVAGLRQVAGQVPFHLKTGVIGPDRNAHQGIVRQLGLVGRVGRVGQGRAPAIPASIPSYTVRMKTATLRLAGLVTLTLSTVLGAQAPAGQKPEPAVPAPAVAGQPQFRVAIDYVTTDAIARNAQDQFVADLTKSDFEIFEDGVKQEITGLTLVHGGRVHNLAAPAPVAAQEGIIMPPSRPKNDTAGRIFLIIVDDLHLDFRNTGRIRDLFKKISKSLVHEGDMFSIVSTGPSSLAIDPTYDRKILDEAIKKITGNGLKPADIIQGAEGSDGPSEVRYRANVAFSTAYDMLSQMEKINNRRKAVIWVSNGYDFNPFAESRLGEDPVFGGRFGQTREEGREQQGRFSGQQFSDADLARELAEVTRTANRANATLYTIDPRGLVAGADLDEQLDPVEYSEHVRKTQDSLRVLAEETGGIAVVNQNNFDKALKRIDAETSDYYVLGYSSTNPDPLKRTRKIEVKLVNRPGVSVWSRTSYSLRQLPKAQ